MSEAGKLKPGVTRIRSRLLGEDLIVAEPPASLPGARIDHPDLVVYWPDEIEQLAKVLEDGDLGEDAQQTIQDVHMVKKDFQGHIEWIERKG